MKQSDIYMKIPLSADGSKYVNILTSSTFYKMLECVTDQVKKDPFYHPWLNRFGLESLSTRRRKEQFVSLCKKDVLVLIRELTAFKPELYKIHSWPNIPTWHEVDEKGELSYVWPKDERPDWYPVKRKQSTILCLMRSTQPDERGHYFPIDTYEGYREVLKDAASLYQFDIDFYLSLKRL